MNEISETEILELAIADMGEDEACLKLFERIALGLKTKVSFINARKVYLRDKNPNLQEVLQGSDFRFADGYSLIWAAGRLQKTLLHRTTGVGLMRRMLENAAAYGCRAYFLGAKEEVVSAAAENAKKLYSDCVAGWRNGYFTAEETDTVIREINASAAQILFCGMGSPKQELWLHENAGRLRPAVLMGVGGSFDVLAGLKKRAPAFIADHGLEWLWRFFQSPVKMARRVFIENIYFVRRVSREKRRLTRSGGLTRAR